MSSSVSYHSNSCMGDTTPLCLVVSTICQNLTWSGNFREVSAEELTNQAETAEAEFPLFCGLPPPGHLTRRQLSRKMMVT